MTVVVLIFIDVVYLRSLRQGMAEHTFGDRSMTTLTVQVVVLPNPPNALHGMNQQAGCT